jgi:four helix bundle protein
VRIVGAHRRRASQAIALNIAEGNGKATSADRRRSFESARGSALECAAIQTCSLVCDALSADDNSQQKALLDRRVAMLTKLGQPGYAVSEELGGWVGRFDTDADTDADSGTE